MYICQGYCERLIVLYPDKIKRHAKHDWSKQKSCRKCGIYYQEDFAKDILSCLCCFAQLAKRPKLKLVKQIEQKITRY